MTLLIAYAVFVVYGCLSIKNIEERELAVLTKDNHELDKST